MSQLLTVCWFRLIHRSSVVDYQQLQAMSHQSPLSLLKLSGRLFLHLVAAAGRQPQVSPCRTVCLYLHKTLPDFEGQSSNAM